MGDTQKSRATREAADVELDLHALATALWRRRFLIAGLVLLAGLGTFLYLSSLTPRYTAETRILIESRENAFTLPLQRQDVAQLDQEAVASQVQVLMSRDLAREVVNELDLTSDREFDPRAEPPSLMRRALALLGLARDPAQRTIEQRVLDRFADRLIVYQVGESRVISASFTSSDPEKAARIANALAQTYIDMQQAAKIDTTRQASLWLGSEIEELRERVAEAERRVEAFRSESGLYIGANNTSLSQQQLTELNRQLAEARAARSAAETRAEAIRSMLASGGEIDATSAVLNSPLIQRLQESQVTLQARQAELASTYLPQHPRMREIGAQLGDLQAQIRDEATKIARGLESDASLAEAQQAALAEQLETLKGEAAAANESDVQLRALEREARAERELLESYLGRFREASARESFAGLPTDARVISRAAAPNDASFPSTGPMTAAAALAALLLSLGGVVTAEFTSGRAFVRPDEDFVAPPVESATMPDVAPEPAAGPSIARSVEELVAALREAGLGTRAKRVLVAPMDGAQDNVEAAACLVALARALTADGDKVVMIDADLANPRLGALVGREGEDGLVHLLSGDATFASVLFRDAVSRSHILPAGTRGEADTALLDTPRMEIVLDALGHTYDAVLIAAGGEHAAALVDLEVRVTHEAPAEGEAEGGSAKVIAFVGEAGWDEATARAAA